MRILFTAATHMELEPFLLQNTGADYLITGVGVPATLYQLQKRLHQMDYDLVVQAGIAGCFGTEIPLSTTVLVARDCFADLGVSRDEKFSDVFSLGFADESAFPLDKGWLDNPAASQWPNNLLQADGVTVNHSGVFHPGCLARKETGRLLVESMEGAALHYCCLMESVPFIQVRGISNRVGETDKSSWDIPGALQTVTNTLNELIRHPELFIPHNP